MKGPRYTVHSVSYGLRCEGGVTMLQCYSVMVSRCEVSGLSGRHGEEGHVSVCTHVISLLNRIVYTVL